MPTFLAILLSVVGVLLMFVILLQRGRGGGLAGALGGAGGQSAFGTKAGDVFTKITVIMAVIWVVLAGGTGIAMYKGSVGKFPGGSSGESSVGKPADPDSTDTPGTGLLNSPIDDETKTEDDPDANKPDTEKPETDESAADEASKDDSDN